MDAPSTTLHSGVRVPVLSLDSLLQGPEDPEEEPYGRESAPGHGAWALLRPHGYAPPDSSAALGALLDEAGDARFLRRSGTFRVLLQEEDPDQLIYAALMESLGYSQNRQPFLELAHRVSYETLVKATLRCAAGSGFKRSGRPCWPKRDSGRRPRLTRRTLRRQTLRGNGHGRAP